MNCVPDKEYFVIGERYGMDNWDFYREQVDFFDFSKFGCNEPYVRELVKALDKRYGYNKGE